MKTRREFIRDMLLASMILGGSCISGGCSPSSREGFASRDFKEQNDVLLLGPEGHTILHNASLAPSGHNSQLQIPDDPGHGFHVIPAGDSI